MMKRIMVAGWLAGLAGGVAHGQAPQPEAPPPAAAEAPAPAPKIVCPEKEYDFGEKANNQDVEHTYVVRNEGNLTLEIKSVRASCGCTAVNLSENMVPPGGEAKINAKLNLRGRTGQQFKNITVECNDPATPTVVLVLKGNAVAELAVNPAQIFFGRLQADTAITGAVEIVSQGTNGLHLTGIKPDQPAYGAVVETVEEGKHYRVLISSRPPLAPGELRGGVVIQTDHPNYPSLYVPVAAFVEAPPATQVP